MDYIVVGAVAAVFALGSFYLKEWWNERRHKKMWRERMGQ